MNRVALSRPIVFTPPARQRGAALVVAAVFLVVVMVVLGDVTLRLSSTDVTDSALQADAVDALFLAETGLEHAAARLADGIACLDLVTGSPVDFGRGDFQTTQAAEVGSDCRVRVTGRVLFGGTSLRAQRTVEGLLSPQAGGGTWAVGAGGTLLSYNGSAWALEVSGTGNNLNDITCADNECFAVGDGGTILHWDGSAWSDVSPGGGNFEGVACEPDEPDSCFAVGSGGIYYWNGSDWNSAAGGDYNDVYCDTGRCYFAGDNGAIAAWPSTLEWNSNNRNLNGIACLPNNDNHCFAVGANGTIRERGVFFGIGFWGGNNSDTNRQLYDIACPTDNFCVASGHNGTLLHGNGTGSWLDVGSPTNRHLHGIACEADADDNCFAVGRNGEIVQYDGNWSTMASPTGTHLNGVHVSATGGGGSAVLLSRWWEIIN
ncbi:beta propeller repeat protein [Thiohalobacter thiocyanaticus]|uniref:Uncharacterized protein n=1 Tax=Thiohalobacter thiocyanaticus TaxID=585455 RepID=A0A426QJW3_9GAMM|nr:PilX N-terminal domain-containing pilus assembly protein [Thiohalobacter thiocyanaticus]RRQ21996.1 hypothetical protein D6C00_08565 [Thiohalobacter thiocyanaticus]